MTEEELKKAFREFLKGKTIEKVHLDYGLETIVLEFTDGTNFLVSGEIVGMKINSKRKGYQNWWKTS